MFVWLQMAIHQSNNLMPNFIVSLEKAHIHTHTHHWWMLFTCHPVGNMQKSWVAPTFEKQ